MKTRQLAIIYHLSLSILTRSKGAHQTGGYRHLRVRTRSIAMSEISGIEEQDHEDDDSNFGTITSVEPRSAFAGGGNEASVMEFDVF